jgi:co-chaperonin GroES (HSP10)
MIPRAIRDKLIVEKDEHVEHTIGGIVIPESLERTPRFGGYTHATVLSVGADVKDWKAGDRMMLREVWGDEIIHDNRTLTILTDRAARDCLRVS